MRILFAIVLSLPLLGQEICVTVPETLHYSLEYKGKNIGKSVSILDTTIYRGKTVYKLLSVTDVIKQGKNIRDSVILYFGKNWTPIHLVRYIKGMNLSLTTQYEDGKAHVKLNFGEKEKSFTISYPEGAIDNEEVLLFLRCLDIEKLRVGEIVDITPLGGRTVKIKWKFDGIVQSNGKKTAKVLLKMPLKKVEIFIRKGKIVKYIDKSSGLEMILKE